MFTFITSLFSSKPKFQYPDNTTTRIQKTILTNIHNDEFLKVLLGSIKPAVLDKEPNAVHVFNYLNEAVELYKSTKKKPPLFDLRYYQNVDIQTALDAFKQSHSQQQITMLANIAKRRL